MPLSAKDIVYGEARHMLYCSVRDNVRTSCVDPHDIMAERPHYVPPPREFPQYMRRVAH